MSEVSLEVIHHVALIRLNKPERMNTLSQLMIDELNAAYEVCENNDEVRVIVVTGSGRAFCAGADMSGGGDTFNQQADMSFSSCPITPAWKLKKPVIGALNGHAVGVGFGLALQFDFRFVAEDAKYGLLQVRRGVLADCCSHWLLPRMLGTEKALEILLLGRSMKGNDVFAKGLATACCPAEKVLEAAMAFANEMVANSAPVVMAMAKRLVWRSFEMTLHDFEILETNVLHQSMGSADSIEGGMAFFEKREPVWQDTISNGWPRSLQE